MSGPVQPPLTVETVDGATVGRPITKIKVTNGTLAVSGSTATLTISGGGGGSGTVTSVGLTETGSALTITGSPVTTSGTINIAGAGTSSQVILGDLSLGTLTSGTVTGTGTANQVSYWTAASVQAGSTGLTYNPSTGDLTVGGYVEVGTKITTPTGTDLTLDTVNGTDSGSIVIADGVDGQISITPNGVGIVKVGSTGNPVRVSNVYTLPTAVTTDNNYVLTAQTDGSTAWAASGGSGGAPTDAEYITLSANGSLTNERVITAGTGIGFTDGGAGSALTIFNAGVTLLTAGTGISLNSSTGGVIITNTVAAGTITGSITDNQIAVGATTGNELEGNAKFTYDQTTQSLNIAAGTGTGTILSGSSDMVIRNSSGTAHSKITLGHDAANSNIKLDTDGTGLVEIHKEGSLAYSLPNVVTGANDYVLTAQTDGSTAWAASGGGGSSNDFSKILPQIGSMSAANQYNISTSAPWGGGQIVTQAISSMGLGARPYAFPFIAPETATVSAVGVVITTAESGVDLYVGIYENDSNNLPSTRVGYATIDMSSTGTIYSTSIVGTLALTAGEQYWYSINTSANVFNGILDSVSTSTGVFSATPLGLTDDINDLNYSIKDTTVSANAVPPSTYSTDDLDGSANRVVVGLKF